MKVESICNSRDQTKDSSILCLIPTILKLILSVYIQQYTLPESICKKLQLAYGLQDFRQNNAYSFTETEKFKTYKEHNFYSVVLHIV